MFESGQAAVTAHATPRRRESDATVMHAFHVLRLVCR
jgi:hypothetical protein